MQHRVNRRRFAFPRTADEMPMGIKGFFGQVNLLFRLAIMAEKMFMVVDAPLEFA